MNKFIPISIDHIPIHSDIIFIYHKKPSIKLDNDIKLDKNINLELGITKIYISKYFESLPYTIFKKLYDTNIILDYDYKFYIFNNIIVGIWCSDSLPKNYNINEFNWHGFIDLYENINNKLIFKNNNTWNVIKFNMTVSDNPISIQLNDIYKLL